MVKSAGLTSVLHAIRWRIWWSGGKVSTHCEFRHTCMHTMLHTLLQHLNYHAIIQTVIWNRMTACDFVFIIIINNWWSCSKWAFKSSKQVKSKLCNWTRESTPRFLSKHLTECRPADLTSVFSAMFFLAAHENWNVSASRNSSKLEILKVFLRFTDASMHAWLWLVLNFTPEATASLITQIILNFKLHSTFTQKYLPELGLFS